MNKKSRFDANENALFDYIGFGSGHVPLFSVQFYGKNTPHKRLWTTPFISVKNKPMKTWQNVIAFQSNFWKHFRSRWT